MYINYFEYLGIFIHIQRVLEKRTINFRGGTTSKIS